MAAMRPPCSPPWMPTAIPTAATVGASSLTCAVGKVSPVVRLPCLRGLGGHRAPTTSPRAVELCDWLASVSLPDGGLPFALPVVRQHRLRTLLGAGRCDGSPRSRSAPSSPLLPSALPPTIQPSPHIPGWPRQPATALPPSTPWRMHPSRSWSPPRYAVSGCRARYQRRRPPRCSSAWAAYPRRGGLWPVTGGTVDEMMRALDFAAHPGRPGAAPGQPGRDRCERAAAASGRATGRRRVARRLSELLPAGLANTGVARLQDRSRHHHLDAQRLPRSASFELAGG